MTVSSSASATFRTIVDDVDAVLPFYETLGFKLAQRWGPPFAVISRGALKIWLSGPGTSARKAMDDGELPVPGGWNRVVVEVEDIEGLVVELEKAGGKARNKPLKGPGGTQCVVVDPSGNPVELFQAAAGASSS